MEKEIFKPIPNYEGIYEISNKCRIKALPKEVLRDKCGIKKFPESFKRINNSNQVCLFKDKKRKWLCVKKIYMLVFENKEIKNTKYESFPKDELVYNHNGENLFWRHYNPEDIPMLNRYALVDGEAPPYPPMWKTDYGMYSAKGLDCDGVPAFSHGTANEIVKDHTRDLSEYEPLTVEIVRWWFGWFLYQLENSRLGVS